MCPKHAWSSNLKTRLAGNFDRFLSVETELSRLEVVQEHQQDTSAINSKKGDSSFVSESRPDENRQNMGTSQIIET